jgi:hypothetical protein
MPSLDRRKYYIVMLTTHASNIGYFQCGSDEKKKI